MRKPPAPSPRRSDATRDRIMRAAQELFARDGYERTTIRAVAADAAIDPAMVMRYFSNKEGLFAAVAKFDLQLPDARTMPQAEIGLRFATHFLQRWETGPSASALQVLLRAATTNEVAEQRVRAIFEHQLKQAFAAIVPTAELTERASLVAAHILGVALCRYILRLPGIATLAPEKLCAWIGPALQHYLFGKCDNALASPPSPTPSA